LYRGIKLKVNVGKITSDTVVGSEVLDVVPDPTAHHHNFDLGDGIAEIVGAILLWILSAILVALAIWIFRNVVLVVIAAFSAMLYWIFFRAIRLVFKNSNKSKGKVWESIKYGLTYTFLYNFWIYAIFLLAEYFKS
jgi:glycerol-3-phosphate acyltransferase PlsY